MPKWSELESDGLLIYMLPDNFLSESYSILAISASVIMIALIVWFFGKL